MGINFLIRSPRGNQHSLTLFYSLLNWARIRRHPLSLRRRLQPGDLQLAARLLAAIGTVVIIFLGVSSPAQEAKKPAEKPLFRVGVETVFVKVSVTDPLNRYVTGLEKDHFKVFEDKVEQQIVHFTQESAPISVGIIFDVSGSMKDNNNIGSAKNAIARFLQQG